MKIAYIETSGFRGFRGPFRLNLSPSFTIIYGRNGVGKSTVCDALEYAITGTIDKYRVEKTAKENLNDYLWFRPEEGLKDCYVRIGLIDETTGEQRTITRSREQQLDEQSMAMVRELIRASSLEYEDAVRQLVKTTIIRDEWIAEQSLDLSEYERFRFVSATLGSVDFGEYLKRIDGAARIAQSARDGLRNDAQLQQQTLSQMQAEFARLKAESDKGNLATALEQ
jgi:chromosome segregation ATPase